PLLERARIDPHGFETVEQGGGNPVRPAQFGQTRVRMAPAAADRRMASASEQMIGVDGYRRFFAEEIQACAGIDNQTIVDAFCAVPRERFLGPGPWIIKTDTDFGGPARQTPDADPRRIYHNIPVAIDPARHLFNGQPSTLASWIEALEIRAGSRVLHIGA